MAGDELKNSRNHFELCHERWIAKRNRRQEEADYKDSWYSEQCGFCKFWIPLTGIFSGDYGVCSNSLANYDGKVRFEHDGCEKFEEAEDWSDE